MAGPSECNNDQEAGGIEVIAADDDDHDDNNSKLVVNPTNEDYENTIETIDTGVMRAESVHENLMKRYRCRSCDITLVILLLSLSLSLSLSLLLSYSLSLLSTSLNSPLI